MKKICIFCSLSSFNTGMPISTYKLAAGLAAKAGVSVCAVLPSEGELAERLRGAGVDVHVVPFQRVRRKISRIPRTLLTWITAGRRLCKLIRNRGIDIVHFSDVIDAPYYFWACVAGAKTVAHVRVCIGSAAVKYLYRVWANIFCSRVITVSMFVKRYYGFGNRALVVYNPGPDREIFDPKRYGRASGAFVDSGVDAGVAAGINTDVDPAIDTAKGRMAASIPTVIAVSSFRREKGLHNFIEIAARIRERFSGDLNFVIVG
ncbi:MAG: glycosyltransferase, partial [Chitinispirillales bacterium]|nr:glycosyltransferase [Chitinispirillales bacterium]